MKKPRVDNKASPRETRDHKEQNNGVDAVLELHRVSAALLQSALGGTVDAKNSRYVPCSGQDCVGPGPPKPPFAKGKILGYLKTT